MFHSHLQYSLLNWGRACKRHCHKLVILQNNILRVCLFRPLHHPTNLLYSACSVLNLEDLIKMEFAKFMFKFSNNMLPTSFNNYFLKLDKVHNHKTRQKTHDVYFQSFVGLETGRKTLHHICLKLYGQIYLKRTGTVFFPNLKSISKQMYYRRIVPLINFFRLVY